MDLLNYLKTKMSAMHIVIMEDGVISGETKREFASRLGWVFEYMEKELENIPNKQDIAYEESLAKYSEEELRKRHEGWYPNGS